MATNIRTSKDNATFLLRNHRKDIEMLERKHGVRIFINMEDNLKGCEIQINGTPEIILHIKKDLEKLIWRKENRLPPTHFLSLPLSDSPDFLERVKILQDFIVSKNFPQDFNSNTFIQPPSTMHLTLFTLSLRSTDEPDDLGRIKSISEACHLFKSLENDLKEILKSPIRIHVSGLRVMGNDEIGKNGIPKIPLEKATILYAIPKEVIELSNSKNIQILRDFLIQNFKKSGFFLHLPEPNESFLLHMTIGKTDFTRLPGSNKRIRHTIDARPIIDTYGNYDFGSTSCSTLQICQMGTKGQGSKGGYKDIASMDL